MSPRPSRPWFRFYVEAIWDRKLRRLPPAQRWLWVVVLGVARSSPQPGYLMVGDAQPAEIADLVDAASLRPSDVRAGLKAFESAGMLERDAELGALRVVAWDFRQFEKTDNTTARTAKHRSKGPDRNVPTTSEGTPPETEAETDPPSGAPKRPRKQASKPRSPAETKPTQRGALFVHLIAALGVDVPTLTADERADVNRTVKNLAEVGAEPKQLAGFVDWWHETFKGAELTHRCYRMHWSKYLSAGPVVEEFDR